MAIERFFVYLSVACLFAWAAIVGCLFAGTSPAVLPWAGAAGVLVSILALLALVSDRPNVRS